MKSKGLLTVFLSVLCCTRGVIITNLQDYCTKINDYRTECKGLNFGSYKEVEFDINNKLDGNDIFFSYSDLFTIPKNAFKISNPVISFTMHNCGLREIYRHNFESGDNIASTTWLQLTDNYIERIPGRAFELLPTLRLLMLNSNRLTTLDADCFVGLTNLTDLALHGNSLRTLPHDVLAPLRSLKDIYLQGNKLEYLPQNVFSNNKQLEVVWVQENKLKVIDFNVPKDPVSLQYVLKNLNRSIESTNIDIWNIPSLIQVDFTYNYLPYISRHSFPKATKLTSFTAYSCQLTTVESGAFSSQVGLQMLVLSENKLESFDLNQLSKMKDMYKIDLRSNKLKEFDFYQLEGNKKLQEVFLAGNPFTCKLNNDIVQFFLSKNIVTDLEKMNCTKSL